MNESKPNIYFFVFQHMDEKDISLEVTYTDDAIKDKLGFTYSVIHGSPFAFGCLIVNDPKPRSIISIRPTCGGSLEYVDISLIELLGGIGPELFDKLNEYKYITLDNTTAECVRYKDLPLNMDELSESKFEDFIDKNANYSIGKVPGKYYLRHDVDVFYKNIAYCQTYLQNPNRDNFKCVFCDIANCDPKNQIIKTYYAIDHDLICDVVIIEPLNPVVSGGHYLAIPKMHVCNTLDDNPHTASVYASTMKAAAMFARSLNKPNNIITSTGEEATQTVFHLNIHIVTRSKNDNLMLPWTNQNK